MNYNTLSPAASLSPPSISSGDTDSDDQHISSPNSFSYYQANNSSSSSNTSVSESPDLGFEQFLPDIGLQATMEELGMSIDGWEHWNDTNKPLDPAMLFLDLDGLGGAEMPSTPATTHASVSLSPANPNTPSPPGINPNLALPKSKFAAARASHLLSIPTAPTLDVPQPTSNAEPLSAADDIAQRILARTRAAAAKQMQMQQPQLQAHIPGSMPGIVMPSLPPVPSAANAAPNVPTDPNAFASMQLDANEAALSNEYLAILQNAQSMPDFFSAAFNTTLPTVHQPPVPPTLPTLPDTAKTAQTAAPPLRTKTSHTTIERRYRTNLNTRITALRHAVPALRVLDKAAFPNEQPDEHGLCDGVRPARKASKASVLGKATEYIRVLKRREKRLEGTVGGLKALVKCISGEEVVKEWEAEWIRVHGGPETDSIGVDDAPEAEGDGDDDESDGDEPRAKRARANPTLNAPNAAPAAATGEKRKRGRPRKSPQIETFPAPVAIAPAPVSDNGKYLLGVFLFFSFFKGGVRHAPVHHTHVGSVISHASSVITSPSEVKSPWDFAHAAHTIFSIVLLLSLTWGWMRSWLGSKTTKGEGQMQATKKALAKGHSLSVLSRFWSASQLYFSPMQSDEANPAQREAVLALLLAPVCAPLARRFWSQAGKSSDHRMTLTKGTEAEGEDTPLPSPNLLENSGVVRSAVLSLAVEDAEAAYISALGGNGIAGDERAVGDKSSDIFDFIAAAQVVDVMFDLAAGKFVEASGSSPSEPDTKISTEDAADAMLTVSRLGRGLQSQRLRSIIKAWENACGAEDRASPAVISDSQEPFEGESEKLSGVRALVRVLELHRKVYPDAVSTPTLDGTSAPRTSAALALRVALGMPVFDSREELENARDQMVDRLVEA